MVLLDGKVGLTRQQAGAREAQRMGDMGFCWCCADRLYTVDTKMIRAKKADCPWVLKLVCTGCHQLVKRFPNRIEQIEGEFWTLRPMVHTPVE